MFARFKLWLHRANRVALFFLALVLVVGGLALRPASAHAQVDNHPCAPGKACKVWSLQTYNALTVAQLPACTAGAIGKIIWATNGGSDGGGSTVQCDGANWVSMGGGGNSAETTTLTATAPLVLYDDGGTVNLSIGIEKFDDDARDVANITAGRTVTYAVSTTGTVFEAEDTCAVGMPLNTTGGLAGTLWQCWPSDQLQITVRVACVAAADCDPASQNLAYTMTCPDGSCR